MLNTNCNNKRKATNEKEILDFFSMLEDKFENNTQKLQCFIEILSKYSNSNEEEMLLKMRDVLADYPILILELNKMLPKSSRLPLVDQENADNFLVKIRDRDEYVFKEIMKSLFSFKKEEINQDKLVSRFEELLSKYGDLLEEAYLFLDYKRISNAAYKKNLMNKLASSRYDLKRNLQEKPSALKFKESFGTPSKNQSNPEYLFFESLKNIIDPEYFKILIKLLHLYNEGILNHSEFSEMITPYLSNHPDLLEYLKTLTYSKIMNRRQFSLINKPLSEMDLSKSRRIGTSYSELPKEYPHLICSGRTEGPKILNDRLISIPAGSEDDKNPLKKNHYEEHIFKFEDQRYEVDMIIEILKFAIDELNSLNEKVISKNFEAVEIENYLGKSTIRFISFFYKEHCSQILQGMRTHPKEAVPIVISRFMKRIEEALNQKAELEKNIKMSFDRFYYKSFDHRSFKLKNFEKKSNNAKAFVKEMITRKKEKSFSNILSILKGGTENFEFFNSINFKLAKENMMKTISESNDEILMKNYELSKFENNFNLRKLLPDMRLVIDNVDILKIAISLIFYQIYFTTGGEAKKILESLAQLFEALFRINLNDLINMMCSSGLGFSNDKDGEYEEAIESIKTKQPDTELIEKLYNIEMMSKYIVELDKNNNENSLKNYTNLDFLKSSTNLCDNNSEISLTPSLMSQDTGKTFKDLIILDEEGGYPLGENLKKSVDYLMDLSHHNSAQPGIIEENKFSNEGNNTTFNTDKETLFLPKKNKSHILFYANENWFVIVRFIFCIYERINKLYEYALSVTNETTLYSSKNLSQLQESNTSRLNKDTTTFKNFVVLYKALIHKKIENTANYEELCRDILGNDSYFLFGLDKLINALIKTVVSVNNDPLSKDIILLFNSEKNRKNYVSESLYFSNFLKLFDGVTNGVYRILFSPELYVMTIHLHDISNETSKKDYLKTFQDFLSNVLQESYQKLEEENFDPEETSSVFLKRNKNVVIRKRDCSQPDTVENNLMFKFDYATKSMEFLKSGHDVVIFKKHKISKQEKFRKVVKNNFRARALIESQINIGNKL